MGKRKLLLQRKNLVDGREFLIYSKKVIEEEKIYSCNLCGVKKIRGTSGLKFHDGSIVHRELSKLEKIPYKNWMTDCIINNKPTDTSKSIKTLMKTEYGAEKSDKEHEKHKKAKKKLPRSYRNKSKHSDIDSDSPDCTEKSLSRLVSRNNDNTNEEPTILSISRQLLNLNDYLEDNMNQRIKDLLVESVELEGKCSGSSNTLLTQKNMQLLYDVKASLSASFDKMPFLYLSITSSVFEKILFFTDKFTASCMNAKKIKQMMEEALETLE